MTPEAAAAAQQPPDIELVKMEIQFTTTYRCLIWMITVRNFKESQTHATEASTKLGHPKEHGPG